MVGQMFCRGMVACDECTKNCLRIHHLERRGTSSTAHRFFKVMLGEKCSEVLYLPPKFARDVRDLVGQETQIEDSNGEKWTVQFSYVDGALAFQEGWHKFVEDHQLENGEFLVFNYIKHRHFVVQIYGPSACEIMDFSRRRKLSKKRSRSGQETIFQDEPHQIRNERFARTSKNMEDPSCMLNDPGKYEVEDRDFLLDLSNFEMGKKSSVSEKTEASLDKNITPVETQIREPIEVMRNDNQMSIPLTDKKNNHSCGISADAFQTKPPGNTNSIKDMPDDVSKFQAGETRVSTPFVARDMKSPYICSSLLAESDYSINSKHCDASATSSILMDPFGKSAATFNFKKEVVKLGEEAYGFTRGPSDTGGQISSSCVKTEPDMDDVLSPTVATSPFSAEVKSLKFLDLPLGMPSIQGKREQGRWKVVYLKGSTTRLWPVLYPGKSFVRVFTDGWKTFCKGNSIRAGDVCRFQVETYMPCVFKVDIIRKAGKSSGVIEVFRQDQPHLLNRF